MFIFGYWVCIADGAGNFHRHIAPTLEKKQYDINLYRQALKDFIEKFNEIFDLFRGLGDESEYNSTSPTSRIGSHELMLEPSCELVYNTRRFPFRLRNSGAAYQAILSKPQFNSDLIEGLGYYSDPDEKTPLSGPKQGLVITSTSQGRFVYWPNMKPPDLAKNDESRLVAYLDTFPYQEGTPLSPIYEEDGSTEIIRSSSGSFSPERELFA
uniref:Uncharacterized protein n=1 Tax=Setaria viridis TaxID=4556 RepID=A0A4U6VNF4_SETVI|nr:hypothetical protein SEVIR_2G095280v2 [Setaria viridis]